MKRPAETIKSLSILARYLPSEDTIRFAWRGLRRFHNAAALAARVMADRGIPEKHERNVKKQMLQIRYCLIQAKEYFDAAEVASLATKGVQLYYCCMSLALAQILWKGTGDDSLDKMRQQHRHHGLDFVRPDKLSADLAVAGAQLVARPNVREGTRVGTFELWHRTARHLPLVGMIQRMGPAGAVKSLGPILLSRDERLPELGEAGVTLLECVERAPGTMAHLATLGMPSHLVRSTFTEQIGERDDGTADVNISMTVHPARAERIDQIKESIAFDANAVDRVSMTEFRSGFALSWSGNTGTADFRGVFPEGFSITPTETYLLGHDDPLNEFGYLYAGLYICGMFSRYYPDMWQKEIETSSDLSLCIEYFLQETRERLALLTLMELESACYVRRD